MTINCCRLRLRGGAGKVNQLLNRKSVDQIAREVIHGFWGNGNDRILHLKQAGYDPIQIQKRVNQLL
jgi:lysozyme